MNNGRTNQVDNVIERESQINRTNSTRQATIDKGNTMKDTRNPVTAIEASKILREMSQETFNTLFRIKGERGGILKEFAEMNPNHELTKFVEAHGSHFRFVDAVGVEKVVRINGAKVVDK